MQVIERGGDREGGRDGERVELLATVVASAMTSVVM